MECQLMYPELSEDVRLYNIFYISKEIQEECGEGWGDVGGGGGELSRPRNNYKLNLLNTIHV